MLALDRDPIVPVQSEAEATNFNPAVFAKIPKASAMYPVLKVVASKHLDTIAFAVQDSRDDNITWIQTGADPVRYSGGSTVQEVETWVRARLTKSEAVPETPTEEGSAVQIVVGTTFENQVLREDKDVFLLVYAPWCGFSRKFLPTWEAVARKALRLDHLVIAKMDGDLNGSPFPNDFHWDAYPTLFYVKAGERIPHRFQGNRSIDHLMEFASQFGSKPFVVSQLDGGDESEPEL